MSINEPIALIDGDASGQIESVVAVATFLTAQFLDTHFLLQIIQRHRVRFGDIDLLSIVWSRRHTLWRRQITAEDFQETSVRARVEHEQAIVVMVASDDLLGFGVQDAHAIGMRHGHGCSLGRCRMLNVKFLYGHVRFLFVVRN